MGHVAEICLFMNFSKYVPHQLLLYNIPDITCFDPCLFHNRLIPKLPGCWQQIKYFIELLRLT